MMYLDAPDIIPRRETESGTSATGISFRQSPIASVMREPYWAQKYVAKAASSESTKVWWDEKAERYRVKEGGGCPGEWISGEAVNFLIALNNLKRFGKWRSL